MCAVAARQHDVVGQRDDPPFLETSQHGVIDSCTAELVGKLDDLADGAALRFVSFPTRELLGDGVEILDVAMRIRGHDGIADRLQRDLSALLLVEQRTLRGLALRYVGDSAFVVERVPVGIHHDARVFDCDDRAPVAPAQLILEVAHAPVSG